MDGLRFSLEHCGAKWEKVAQDDAGRIEVSEGFPRSSGESFELAGVFKVFSGANFQLYEVLQAAEDNSFDYDAAIKSAEGVPTGRVALRMRLSLEQYGGQKIVIDGTEGEGVFCYDIRARRYIQFTTKDGLGDDDAFAVAVDRLGRVWVGHLSHGVSVLAPGADFQKRLAASRQTEARSAKAVPTIARIQTDSDQPKGRWQNYEVIGGLGQPDSLSGPLGERVFDIAVCPSDGNVWIATSAGIARYAGPKDAVARERREAATYEDGTWRCYGRAEGLPSDQAQALSPSVHRRTTIRVGAWCAGRTRCPLSHLAMGCRRI